MITVVSLYTVFPLIIASTVVDATVHNVLRDVLQIHVYSRYMYMYVLIYTHTCLHVDTFVCVCKVCVERLKTL